MRKRIIFLLFIFTSCLPARKHVTLQHRRDGYLLGFGALLKMSDKNDGFKAEIFCEIVPTEQAGWSAYYFSFEDACEWVKKHKQKIIEYPLGVISLAYIFLKSLR